MQIPVQVTFRDLPVDDLIEAECLREAQKQGFKRALVPTANVPRKGVIDGIEIQGVSRLAEALDKAC